MPFICSEDIEKVPHPAGSASTQELLAPRQSTGPRSSFMPHMGTVQMRSLLRKRTAWVWNSRWSSPLCPWLTTSTLSWSLTSLLTHAGAASNLLSSRRGRTARSGSSPAARGAEFCQVSLCPRGAWVPWGVHHPKVCFLRGRGTLVHWHPCTLVKRHFGTGKIIPS